MKLGTVNINRILVIQNAYYQGINYNKINKHFN